MKLDVRLKVESFQNLIEKESNINYNETLLYY
jgi:hypothetical protein